MFDYDDLPEELNHRPPGTPSAAPVATTSSAPSTSSTAAASPAPAVAAATAPALATRTASAATAAEVIGAGPAIPRGPAPDPRKVLGRPLRVLALHGGGSNVNVMKYQVMPLKKELGDRAEWDFLNGGRAWTFDNGGGPGPIMESLASGMPFYGWYGVKVADTSDRPYREKLFDPSVDFTYQEVDAGVERVMSHIRDQGPFDVLLGFSQGCIIIHLIAGTLRARGEPIPWRLSVLFNGMRVRDNSYRALFDTPLQLPAVMVFGKQDEFYDYGRASQLELYEGPVALDHDEGHKFPSKPPRAKEIYEAVSDAMLRCVEVPAGARF